MRLCDAIRIGCDGTRQSPYYFDPGGNGACCAIGAASIAVGLRTRESDFLGHKNREKLFNIFPILRIIVKSPVSTYTEQLESIISSLNTRGWTREAIADWIEREFESGARLTNHEVKEEQCQEVELANAN